MTIPDVLTIEVDLEEYRRGPKKLEGRISITEDREARRLSIETSDAALLLAADITVYALLRLGVIRFTRPEYEQLHFGPYPTPAPTLHLGSYPTPAPTPNDR